MIIDCIADLHGYYPHLDGGDLLILAGDYTAQDKLPQWTEFFSWLKKQDYKKKILIAGNHDNFMMTGWPKSQEEAEHLKEVKEFLIEQNEIEPEDFEYLCDNGTEFEGLKIWGSPWTPWFSGVNEHCSAFMRREELLKEKFDLIPDDTDILITHGPPRGILDESIFQIRCGSNSLIHAIIRVEPLYHIFGHMHECGGKQLDKNITKFINCSHCNENYEPVNKPYRLII